MATSAPNVRASRGAEKKGKCLRLRRRPVMTCRSINTDAHRTIVGRSAAFGPAATARAWPPWGRTDARQARCGARNRRATRAADAVALRRQRTAAAASPRSTSASSQCLSCERKRQSAERGFRVGARCLAVPAHCDALSEIAVRFGVAECARAEICYGQRIAAITVTPTQWPEYSCAVIVSPSYCPAWLGACAPPQPTLRQRSATHERPVGRAPPAHKRLARFPPRPELDRCTRTAFARLGEHFDYPDKARVLYAESVACMQWVPSCCRCGRHEGQDPSPPAGIEPLPVV